MADKEKDKNTENKTEDKQDPQKSTKVKIGIVTWLIMIMVIAALSSSGYVVGRLVAGSSPTADTVLPEDEKNTEETPSDAPKAREGASGTWYYETLEPVVVNPDEPGATRFVRVGLILEISNELSQEKAAEMFKNKKHLLINWLNLYFKSLSLDQMENERDMKRILSQICDGFNEILFPEAKPLIKNVLIREFNIQ